MLSRSELMDAIRGPVFPILTAFTKDGCVDFSAMERYVEFLIESGARTLMATIGTSRYGLLSEQEMRDVNACIVSAAARRAVVIVTTPPVGSTQVAVSFVEDAAGIGADAILGVFPERYYGEDGVCGFFEALCRSAEIGIMAHASPMKGGTPRFGASVQYSTALLRRLLEQPNFVGMKEESGAPALIYACNRELGDKMCIIGGAGGMRAAMGAYNWGQRAYLVGIGNFVPQVELAFWKKLTTGDLDSARGIIFDCEEAFFNDAVQIGWHIALKSAMAQQGLIPPYERAPMPIPEEADTRILAKHISRIENVFRNYD